MYHQDNCIFCQIVRGNARCHLIPRQQGDGIGIHSKKAGDPEQLAALAKQIKQALG